MFLHISHVYSFNKYYIESNRSYLVSSLGFETRLYLPFRDAQKIDSGEDDSTGLSGFIDEYLKVFDQMICNKI